MSFKMGHWCWAPATLLSDASHSIKSLVEKAPEAARSPHLEDGSLLAEEDAVKGQLSSVAARLVMKFMWLSRASQPDITFAVNLLAKHITCWSSNDDCRVARLVGYLSSTINLAHHMVVLDPLNELSWILLFTVMQILLVTAMTPSQLQALSQLLKVSHASPFCLGEATSKVLFAEARQSQILCRCQGLCSLKGCRF